MHAGYKLSFCLYLDKNHSPKQTTKPQQNQTPHKHVKITSFPNAN